MLDTSDNNDHKLASGSKDMFHQSTQENPVLSNNVFIPSDLSSEYINGTVGPASPDMFDQATLKREAADEEMQASNTSNYLAQWKEIALQRSTGDHFASNDEERKAIFEQ